MVLHNTARLFFCSVIFLLCSCATQEGYRQILEAYRGASEEKLLVAWGVPNRSYEMANGRKLLVYTENETSIIPGGTTYTSRITSSYGTVGSFGSGIPYSSTSITPVPVEMPDITVRTFCEMTFLLDARREVIDYNFVGKDCVAEEKSEPAEVAAAEISEKTKVAKNLFEKSHEQAEDGNAEAQAMLGIYYTKGEVVEKSPAQAAEWFKRAAVQGLQIAQLGLGNAYLQGSGVSQSDEEAYFWFSLIRNKDHLADNLCKDIEQKSLPPAKTAAIKERVKAWKPKKEVL